MQHVAAAPPASRRRRRRGEAAVADRHHLARPVRRLVRAAPVTSCTRIRQPPSGGSPATAVSPPRLTSTPQPSSSGDPRRGPVGRPALHRRAEVELDAGRHGQPPGGEVDLDRPPPGDHPEPDAAAATVASATRVLPGAWRAARRSPGRSRASAAPRPPSDPRRRR